MAVPEKIQTEMKQAAMDYYGTVTILDCDMAPRGFLERFGHFEYWFNDSSNSTHVIRRKIMDDEH